MVGLSLAFDSACLPRSRLYLNCKMKTRMALLDTRQTKRQTGRTDRQGEKQRRLWVTSVARMRRHVWTVDARSLWPTLLPHDLAASGRVLLVIWDEKRQAVTGCMLVGQRRTGESPLTPAAARPWCAAVLQIRP